MPQNLDLERLVVEKFFKKSQINRYKTFLSNPKNRYKLIADLHRHQIFEKAFFLPLFEQEEFSIKKRLGQLDTHCYIISEDSSIDMRLLEVGEALRMVICSNMNTLLVFGNAKMVYREGEGLKNRWISKPFILS